MKLRIWIPCILLLVILVVVFRNYFLEARVEGFQAGGSSPGLGIDQTRINFWSILSQDKAGLPITSGSKTGSSGSSKSLLAEVMNPGPSDTFKLVYPKYLSMYALAKYNYNPVAAREALMNNYDTLQSELQVNVEKEQATRTRFARDPQSASCTEINTMTMGFYGQLVNLYSKTQDLSGAAAIIADFHKENIDLQTAATAACTNQGATPSAACITLATMDESIFPLLPQFDAINERLMSNGQDIQDIIDTLVQAFMGMGCTRERTATANNVVDESVPSIETVFSSEYLDSLATIDTDTLSETLQELSPYYVSPNIVNYISGRLIGTTEFNSSLTTSIDYIKDMNKTTNSIISLTSDALPAGKYYNESTGGFTNCPPGYYCPPASNPVQCPVGFWCPGMNILGHPTDQPIPCDPSIPYSPVGASSASQCSKNVPPGFYKDPETGELLKCPSGSYCIDGNVISCPAGTFNLKPGMSAITSCLSCPKGAYCKTTTSITPCEPGKYNELIKQFTAAACLPCPAGTTCPNKGTVTAIPCTQGTYSSAIGLATKKCLPVEEGYYLAGLGNKDDIRKIPCSAGYYCPGGTGNQISSPPGTYSDVPQLAEAKKCPAGTYGINFGMTNSTCTGKCDPGHICPAGSSVSNAIPCPEGTYCPEGSGIAITCPAGYYCEYEVAAPTPCPTGTYNDTPGKGSIGDCRPCPPGKQCGVATSIPQPCPAGYYCTGGVGVNVCVAGAYCDETGLKEPTKCPAGTFNPTIGSKSILDCKVCTPGTYSITPGEVGACSQTCPQGMYCPSPNSNFPYMIPPTALPVYGNPPNKVVTVPLGSTQPTICPIGTYCDSVGMFSPTLCPIGTYSSLPGQIDGTACQQCQPGTYCSGLAAGSATPCPPGTYCPITGGIDPNQCLIGQVCPVPGLREGVSCPPGQICDTMGEITPRAPCPPGTYSTGGTSTTCTPCETGYYGIGASTSSQCSGLCPAGYYCLPGTAFNAGSNSTSGSGSLSQTTPLPCPLGYYCPTGTGNKCKPGSYFSNGVCIECAAGKYMIPGAGCANCKAGESSTRGSVACTPCAAGTASVSGGLCGICPAGTYTSGTKCINCRDGESSVEGGVCISCPPGQSSKSGGLCSACTGPPGTYCPGGTAGPVPCAAPVGRYCIGANNQFSVCPPGYVCPGGTGVPSLTQCPYNYRDYGTQCYLPPGKYCETPEEFVIGDRCFKTTGGSTIGTPAITSTGSYLSKMLY